MTSVRTALFALTALGLTACTTTPSQPDLTELTPQQRKIIMALASFGGTYDVSEAAMATAVRDDDGKPVGLVAYKDPSAAVRAGDTAAFIAAIKANSLDEPVLTAFPAMVISFDEAAAGNFTSALKTLDTAAEDVEAEPTVGLLRAWYLALDGRPDEAIQAHRAVGGRLPGLTGDLSLAAMLEALGRTDEALGVYAAMTPTEIVAPEHDFDPQGLIFSHVHLVIARQALLLRQEGRIEEAQALYQRLADAEPEKTTSYQAAIESLATGRGLDEDELTLKSAFVQAMGDYSRSIAFQRILTAALRGDRARGFDDTRGAFDQLSLLIDPENVDLRLSIHDDFFEQALYTPALHILNTAPVANSEIELAKAATLLRFDDLDGVQTALEAALELAEADDRLGTTSAAMGLYSLINNEEHALELAAQLPDMAETPAEKAAAHGMSSAVYTQFSRYAEALVQSRAARELDDTHDRRMALTSALAEAGEIEEGLLLLRTEALSRPNDPYMLNTLGYYLVEHTDRLDEAFRVLARASALAPNDPYIADSFGWIRYKMGDLKGARQYVELSRKELAPNRHWEIEDHLGDIYWHLGRQEDAQQAWAFALKEYPPEEKRGLIEDKLANGLSGPPPEKQPLPDVSLQDDGVVSRNEI